MSSTRKIRPAHYLILLLAGALLSVAITPATQSGVQATTPNSGRGKHNGKIVFISDRDYKGLSVWSMNADGSNARLVTDKVIDAAEPAWSPDGGKIAFAGGVRATVGFGIPSVNIYVVNVDGSGLTQLTRDSGMNGSPAWSPDGTKILFTGQRLCRNTPTFGIYVVNADGSNNRLVTNDPKVCSQHSLMFMPTGSHFLLRRTLSRVSSVSTRLPTRCRRMPRCRLLSHARAISTMSRPVFTSP